MSTRRNNPASVHEPIAVVGMGCRFPGGITSPDELWRFLCGGRDAIGPVPPDRWSTEKLYHPDRDRAGTVQVRAGGFIDGIEQFDAAFFGISPREAHGMDPQQRLLLEVAWEALEDAGIPAARIAGTDAGVFTGIFMHDYENIHAQPSERGLVSTHSATGMSATIIANRLSYLFDLHGPSVVVDTACSSSLTAVHLACMSLRSGECAVALAGGANAVLRPEMTMALCKASMLSPSGRCHPFDARADGYVRAEGAGMVVLKRLGDAMRDGDPVRAVIRGTAVNQDGRSTSLTTPSAEGQAAVARAALEDAGVAPDEVLYVEAHGTGTPVGDPVEAQALGAVFGKSRAKGRPCAIGSLKGNLGHAESAAGVAGIIKAVLILENGAVPPTINHATPNPAIDFAALGLCVETSAAKLPRNRRRIACVNSFGFGGSNAHAVLEAHHISEKSKRDRLAAQVELVPFSAKDPQALRELAARHAALASQSDAPALADIAFTAAQRREHHAHRLCVAASSLDEYRARLDAFAKGEPAPVHNGVVQEGKKPRVAFVFSGMGQQWAGMGRGLMRHEVFRRVIEACDAAFSRLTGEWSLRTLLANAPQRKLDELQHAAPCYFAVQAGIAALLKSWGVEPAAVAGHSTGEIAAAYVAGALSLDAAAKVCLHYGRTQDGLAGSGRMLAAGVTPAEAEGVMRGLDDVCIAAHDAPEQVTLAGDAAALAKIEARLAAQGKFARFLNLAAPYHCAAVDAVLPQLRKSLGRIKSRPPEMPMASTVTGGMVNSDALDAGYWCHNARDLVRFDAAVTALRARGMDTFVEIAAHPLLSAALREGAGIAPVPTLRRGADGHAAMLDAVAALFCRGQEIAWHNLQDGPRRCVRLPGYPWQRQPYWLESETSRRIRTGVDEPGDARMSAHPLRLRQQADGLAWIAQPDAEAAAFLKDHIVDGQSICPGALFCELGLAIAGESRKSSSLTLTDIVFSSPLSVEADAPPEFRVETSSDRSFSISGRARGSAGSWTEVASCMAQAGDAPAPPALLDAAKFQMPGLRQLDRASCYHALRERALEYGPAFQAVETAWLGADSALADIRVDFGRDGHMYRLHPVVLDAAMQTAALLSPAGPLLPVRIARLHLWKSPGPLCRAVARIVEMAGAITKADVTLFDGDGQPCAAVTGIEVRAISGARDTARRLDEVLYESVWLERDPVGAAVPAARALADAVRPSLPALARELRRAEFYRSAKPRLDAAAMAFVAEAFAGMGWEPGTAIDPARLAEKIGTAPAHKRFVELLARRCLEAGLARRNTNGSVTLSRRGEKDARTLWREALRFHPDCLAELALIERCGGALAGVLRGEIHPLGLVFAPGTNTAEHLYETSPSFRYYNRVVRGVVEKIASRLPSSRTLRIIEAGAGTGGTTSHVLPVLPASRCEYVFTDFSPAYFAQAAKRFGGFPFVKFKTLDFERAVDTQSFEPGTFDVVIATDVIHATADVERSLASLRPLLAPGGLLIMTELTAPFAWTDMVFGMFDGWWAFADARRKCHPTMPVAQWRAALSVSGFADVQTLDDRGGKKDALHTVFLAQAEGSGTRKPRRSAKTMRPQILLCADGAAGDEFEKCAAKNGAPLIRAGEGEFQKALPANGRKPPAIVILHAPAVGSDENACNATEDACVRLASIARTLSRRSWRVPASLWIVTCGAQQVCGEAPARPFAAALWGFGRTLITEHAEFSTRMVDLGARPSGAEFNTLLRLIAAPENEDEFALRGDVSFVRRLLRARTPMSMEGGKFSSAHRKKQALGPNDVEIRVMAAGINFKDAVRTSRNGAGRSEAAGLVLRTGKRVRHLNPGDRVAGLVGGIGREIVTLATFLARIPAKMSFEEAATLPIAGLTAMLALEHIARVKKGERVLVHTASGGTGMAMIRIAQRAGAVVLGTAGSPHKRAMLRAMGAVYAGDSRSEQFASEVLELTDGRGVDVAINTLPPTLRDATIRVLNAGAGRLVDLVNPDAQAAGARCTSFDLGAWTATHPQVIRRLLARIFSPAASRPLPPLPHRIVQAGGMERAFTEMRQARHVGKLVVTMNRTEADIAGADQKPVLHGNGTYLVSGGLTGFGLATARWLAGCGARHVALLCRRGMRTPGADEAVAELRASGAVAAVFSADVTDRASLKCALDSIASSMPPLRGIVHAAMVLDDAPAQALDRRRIAAVIEPKARGALLLDEMTRKCALDLFVCYSSFAWEIGNESQAAYSAANAAMEAVCARRSASGRPALTIAWGPVAGAGTVAENAVIRSVLARQGASPLPLATAFDAIARCLREQRHAFSAMRCDWTALARFSRSVAASPRFSQVRHRDEGHDAPAASRPAQERLPVEPGERTAVLARLLAAEVASVLGLDASSIDASRALNSMGFDSLMAVELSDHVERRLRVILPKISLLQGGLTLGGLVEKVDALLPREAEPEMPVLSAGKVPVEKQCVNSGRRAAFAPPPAFTEQAEMLDRLLPGGAADVYFVPSEGLNTNFTRIGGRELVNFSSYNYLGLSGHPDVNRAAQEAVDLYGTSVSASRIASGERPLHRELEQALARICGAEDALAFTSGFGANSHVIGHICGTGDLIVFDSLVHASVQEGARLAGARAVPFPHNNPGALEDILARERSAARQALVVIEGVYSMDGDLPDLPRIIAAARRHNAMLMIDEAHSMGVLGAYGHGVGEHFGIDRCEVDVWMGTLSKSFASCGGYIAGPSELIRYLKHSVPGFVFSAGMTPANAAAALAAIQVLDREPERARRVCEAADLFRKKARAAGLDTGASAHAAVVPVMFGRAERAVAAYRTLFDAGVLALPIMYPAVAADAARLRFFLSALHTEEQIDSAIHLLQGVPR
jgi:8-amino-7-oxononanoate synthase